MKCNLLKWGFALKSMHESGRGVNITHNFQKLEVKNMKWALGSNSCLCHSSPMMAFFFFLRKRRLGGGCWGGQNMCCLVDRYKCKNLVYVFFFLSWLALSAWRYLLKEKISCPWTVACFPLSDVGDAVSLKKATRSANWKASATHGEKCCLLLKSPSLWPLLW